MIQIVKLFKVIPFTITCFALHSKREAQAYCRENKFDWSTELVNGLLLGLLTFCTTLGSLGFWLEVSSVEVAMTAAGFNGITAFFARLAIKRGIYT